MACCPFHSDKSPSIKLDDENVYCKIQGHWIIEMSEIIADINAKSIEEMKSFLSRQKENYKISYETHPTDRKQQCGQKLWRFTEAAIFV